MPTWLPLTYRQIADDLQQNITTGRFPPGGSIPSYSSLAARYGVSVSTAQRAVALLRDRGVVVGAQGRGVFIASEPTS
jgi:GntR family transcriptional regulator